MSRPAKALTLSRVADLALGSFAFVPSSTTLDHLVRYLSTWSGSDKLFMVIQYSLKLVIPFLNLRARLQHRAGMRSVPTSSAAGGLAKFASVWLISIERNRPPTRQLLTIERLQGWSMLFYYPLEHLYYLLAHDVVPAKLPALPLASAIPCTTLNPKDGSVSLDKGALGMWSCRYWALYVFLQFAHLREDSKLLEARARALSKPRIAISSAEQEELKERRGALWNELVVNLAYLPMTLHWSLEKGLVRNEIWMDICGFVAAIASWRSGWKATALPPPAAMTPTEPAELEKEVTADALLDKDILAPLMLDAPIVTGD